MTTYIKGETHAGAPAPEVPVWVKISVGFLAGALLVAASLVKVLPSGFESGAAGSGRGGLVGADGQPLELGEEGYYIDEEGNLVPVGTAGTEGSAGLEGTKGGNSSSRSSGRSGSGGTSSAGGGGSGACAVGKNGGATDKGVSGTKIKLATTAVLDGPAASLLRDSVTGMKAVMEKANRGGGICGRLMELKVDNDSFDAARGLQWIRNYIESEQYFALPVVPSAEGLGSAIQSGEISGAGIPVVGTDGLRQEQYGNAWVWPVATATVSTMRIMAKYGWQNKGARTFAIVWDNKYKFGLEGRNAFVQEVGQMGGSIKADQQLDPDQSSYATEAQTFNTACGGGACDMVALLLLPDTAKKWMARNPSLGRVFSSGAQTLFTDRFGEDCVQAAGEKCHGLTVWTGYNPPIGSLASLPGVSAYVNDVRALNPGIDVRNQFIQGSYLGMSVFVEALKRTGPNLTRAALQDQLDAMDFKNDLASTLSWRGGNHWSNVNAQAFSMVVTQGTFHGWSHVSGFVKDPDR